MYYDGCIKLQGIQAQWLWLDVAGVPAPPLSIQNISFCVQYIGLFCYANSIEMKMPWEEVWGCCWHWDVGIQEVFLVPGGVKYCVCKGATVCHVVKTYWNTPGSVGRWKGMVTGIALYSVAVDVRARLQSCPLPNCVGTLVCAFIFNWRKSCRILSKVGSPWILSYAWYWKWVVR